MATPDTITAAQLSRLVGTPEAPLTIDVRLDSDYASDPRMLGFSRMYRDDLAQLDATMALYDAFYRWARDAVGEMHNWPTPAGGGRS